MRQFFHRLSKWFLDLWRKVIRRPVSSPDFTSNTISEPPQVAFSRSHVSPKEYGEYLLQSGKWKRNRMRNRLKQA